MVHPPKKFKGKVYYHIASKFTKVDAKKFIEQTKQDYINQFIKEKRAKGKLMFQVDYNSFPKEERVLGKGYMIYARQE
jgi:hypothetical protein